MGKYKALVIENQGYYPMAKKVIDDVLWGKTRFEDVKKELVTRLQKEVLNG